MLARFAIVTTLFFFAALIPCESSLGQGFGLGSGLNNRAVGGVKIDAKGVLSEGKALLDPEIRERIAKGLEKSDAQIKSATELRMISLRGLEAAIAKALESGGTVSNEARYMAGLQRIEYVIVEPETNDIILAGPGEGFKVNDQGVVVGSKSGTPVVQLEDFLCAIRSADAARTGQGISVSIDPTQQGIQRLQQFFTSLKRNRQGFDPSMQPKVEKAMGQQTISLTGVPTDSRFSQVLVAADYKMKRLAMGLDSAPIDNFPSFMEMAKKAKASRLSAAPRFWMECSYQPVAKSEDGNVWQIRGTGVKTLTEEEKFDANGNKSAKRAKPNRFAAQWAQAMTERFEELSAAEPAFRELRNVMDISVIAAILKSEGLIEKVGLEIPSILGSQNHKIPTYSVPKTIPAQCSYVRISGSWLVSASGGIQLDSWAVAKNTQAIAEVGEVAKLAAKVGDNWWWNSKAKN